MNKNNLKYAKVLGIFSILLLVLSLSFILAADPATPAGATATPPQGDPAPTQAEIQAAELSLQANYKDMSAKDLNENLGIVLESSTSDKQDAIIKNLPKESILRAANDKNSTLMENNKFKARFTEECVKSSAILNDYENSVAVKSWTKSVGIQDNRNLKETTTLGARGDDRIYQVGSDGTIEMQGGVKFNYNKLGGDNIILGGNNVDGGITVASSNTQIQSGTLNEITTTSGTKYKTINVVGKSVDDKAEIVVDPTKRTIINLENTKINMQNGNTVGSTRNSVEFEGKGNYGLDPSDLPDYTVGTYIPGTYLPDKGGKVILKTGVIESSTGLGGSITGSDGKLIPAWDEKNILESTGTVRVIGKEIFLEKGDIQMYDADGKISSKTTIVSAGQSGVSYLNPADIPSDIGKITKPSIGISKEGELIATGLQPGQNVVLTSAGDGVRMANIAPGSEFTIKSAYGGTIGRDAEGNLIGGAKGKKDTSFREDVHLTLQNKDGSSLDIVGTEQHSAFLGIGRNYDTWKFTTNNNVANIKQFGQVTPAYQLPPPASLIPKPTEYNQIRDGSIWGTERFSSEAEAKKAFTDKVKEIQVTGETTTVISSDGQQFFVQGRPAIEPQYSEFNSAKGNMDYQTYLLEGYKKEPELHAEEIKNTENLIKEIKENRIDPIRNKLGLEGTPMPAPEPAVTKAPEIDTAAITAGVTALTSKINANIKIAMDPANKNTAGFDDSVKQSFANNLNAKASELNAIDWTNKFDIYQKNMNQLTDTCTSMGNTWNWELGKCQDPAQFDAYLQAKASKKASTLK